MASVALAIEQAASQKVEESLWWESHEALFLELDKYASCGAGSAFSDAGNLRHVAADAAKSLTQKLIGNHSWFLNTLLHFRPPCEKSRSALNLARVAIGNHTLDIQDFMKNLAIQLSAQLVLDEVQSYILVSNFFGSDASALSYTNETLTQKIAMKYYLERQCLLKCTRLILLFQMAEESDAYIGRAILEELEKLVKHGLEDKILAVLKRLLAVEQPSHLDPGLISLWAEETAVEQSLVLDILFLLYYEPICPCSFHKWKEIFVMFEEEIFYGTSLRKLALTSEAEKCICHVKHQAILVIIEALDLDKLLMMVFNELPFSQGEHAFTLDELQQIDSMIAGISSADVSEYMPLLLGWASFVCLVSCLPSTEGHLLLEIDHTIYMRQAYGNGVFDFLLDMLHGERFKESDALVGGYKSIVKALVAAFLAAYDVASQIDSTVFDNLVEIFYAIYCGQESLCTEFWDRESAIDGPVRSLIFLLRDCFPYKLIALAQLLACLSEGPWAAECVYDFLYRMVEITSLYEHSKQSSVCIGQVVQIALPLQVPGAPGLLIPAGTRGHILQLIDDSFSLVHWECEHSGIVVILVRMLDQSLKDFESKEVHANLNLICSILSSNKMLARLLLELDCSVVTVGARSNGLMEKSLRVDVLNIICLIMNILLERFGNTEAVVLCMKILSVFSLCCPGQVMLKLNGTSLFQSESDGGSLIEKFSKMMIDSERASSCYLVVVAVLDLCMVLVDKGVRSDSLNMMVTHFIGNLLVNHVNWKYTQKYERWQVATKVLQLMSVVLNSYQVSMELKARVLEMLLVDAAIHGILLQILSFDAKDFEALHFNRHVHVKEIEWFERAFCIGLALVHRILLDITVGCFSKEYSNVTQLEEALWHPSSGKKCLLSAVMSLMSFSKNRALQCASIKAFTGLCLIGLRSRSHQINISTFVLGIEQRNALRETLRLLLCEDMAVSNFELFSAFTDLLTVAAKFQPSLIEILFNPIDNCDDTALPTEHYQPLSSTTKQSLPKLYTKQEGVNAVWKFLEHSKSLLDSSPHILSRVLFFLSSLWQGGSEFLRILEAFCSRETFWQVLATCISTTLSRDTLISTVKTAEAMFVQSFKYQCVSSVLQIMAYDTYLHHHKTHLEGTDSQSTAVENCSLSDSNGKASKFLTSPALSSLQPFRVWGDQGQFSKIIKELAHCLYDKDAILLAKTKARNLAVGLMEKGLSGADIGLSVSISERITTASKSVLNHPAFQDLLTQYSSYRYSHEKDLRILVLSDLYHHLQGELEGGRQIPAGSFHNLVEFLDSIELPLALQPPKVCYVEGFHPPYGDGFMYNASALRLELGLEWWSQTDSKLLPFSVAENMLYTMQHANGIACLGESQLAALEAWTNLVTVSIFDKQVNEAVPAYLKNMWTETCVVSCIQEVCSALEYSFLQLGPYVDSTEYMLRFMSAQSKLLLMLVQVLSHCITSAFSADLSLASSRVFRTIVVCLRVILGSKVATQHVQENLVKMLLECLLICLELVWSKNAGQDVGDEKQPKSHGQNVEDAFVDVALLSMEILPLLCSLVENKAYAIFSLAAIDILVKDFLAPPTWLPILQTHFPIQLTLSRLCVNSDTYFAHQLLSLFLSLACFRGGADMLRSAGFFSNIMNFSNQLREDSLFSAEEKEGPFCVWQREEKHKEGLWGLCVAIVTAVVQSLGDRDGSSTTVENAFLFFVSERDRMLHTLLPPILSVAQGKKKTRYQRPQTTITALQETEHALLLMIELYYYQIQWSNVLQGSESEFQEMGIHLLAYIAREGLPRTMGSNAGGGFRCAPMFKDEMIAHSKPSNFGRQSGWFEMTAKGCTMMNKGVVSSIDVSEPKALQKSSGTTLLALSVEKMDAETFVPVHTQYSDLVALHVYKVAFLLLTFLCKQVQQAVKRHVEYGAAGYSSFPQLPAPEILYGLQDQVVLIITELWSRKVDKCRECQAHNLCFLLLGIIEKALYMEVCVSRIYGFAPLSVRSEDFLKEYKTLLASVQDNHFFEPPLKSLKKILELAYPGFF